MLLGEVKDGNRQETDNEQGDDPVTGVTTQLALDTGEGRGAEDDRGEEEAGEVNPLANGVDTLRQRDRGDDESQRAKDQVEPEDRAPRPDADQNAADDRSIASASPDTAAQAPRARARAL